MMPEIRYSLDRESKIATMTMDCSGPVNTIGQQFITDLEKAVAQANDDQVRGVLFVSAKRTSFLDGANLKEIMTDSTPQMIRIVISRYQDVLASLAKSSFPVVAVLNGQTALGGGFELLLWACDQVFATANSKMGLPETSVGLFPAGGGTQTLRKIVGFKKAIDMITNARVSSAGKFANSTFFTICPPDELQSRALGWLQENQGVVNHNYDPNYQEPDQLTPEEAQQTVNKFRFRFGISPHRPYMLAAIDSMEAGLTLPFEEALHNDVNLFVPLFGLPNTKNKIDFFFMMTSLSRKLAKVDRKKALKTDRIAVIGGGLMGRGIAQVAADKGVKTFIIDVDEEQTNAAVEGIGKTVQELVIRGTWSESRFQSLMANLEGTTDYGILRDVPLVIETVFEDLSLKRKILASVQEVNPEAILASNTSTLPMAEIGKDSSRPEQVVGMHFFSPVPLMPLLEVIQGSQSSSAAVATAVTIGRAIGKTIILVNDGPGFYTSRTFATYINNGFRLAELGISPWDVDMLALQAGFPQGPLHVYGTAGGNVVYHAGSFLASQIPDRLKMPESLAKVVKAGYVGAGKPSFYMDLKKMTKDESILEHIVKASGLPVPTQDEANDILLLGMANEAFWCMSEGVLRDYYSMDLGAVLGIGFPDCWHGPARYVSYRGVQAVKSRLEELKDKFQMESLTPAPEFDQLIVCGLDSHLI